MQADIPFNETELDSQERLMRLLDSVRLEKASEPGESSAIATGCQNCGSREPWGNSSWCPECGYYPKIGRAISPQEMDQSTNSEANEGFNLNLGWVPWLVLGIAVLIAESFAVRSLIPSQADRGFCGRMQLVIGMLILGLAQVRAYVIAAEKTDDVPLSALFFEPGRLWKAVFSRLPDTRKILYLGGWGATAGLLAVTAIGLDVEGMVQGMRPRRRVNPIRAIVKAAAATEGAMTAGGFEEEEFEEEDGGSLGGGGEVASSEHQSLEGAMKSFAGSAATESLASNSKTSSRAASLTRKSDDDSNPVDPKASHSIPTADKKIPKTASGDEREEMGDFIVFGYLTNASGELRSLLLAQVQGKRARFVGKLSLDELDQSTRDHFRSLLIKIPSSRPALPTPYRANWVRPVIRCQVAFTGWTPEGQIREGYLVQYDAAPSSRNGSASDGRAKITR